MQPISVRSLPTTAVPLLAAVLVSTALITPVAAQHDLSLSQVTGVHLTADGSDILGSLGLTDLFNDTTGNIGTLFNGLAYTPLPIIQQLIANQATNLHNLFTGDFDGLVTDIGKNAGGFLGAPFGAFVSDDPTMHNSLSDGVMWSLNDTDGTYNLDGTIIGFPINLGHGEFTHLNLFDGLGGNDGGLGGALVGLLASPLSGILWGGLGVVASPLVETVNEVSVLVGHLGDSDFEAALFDVLGYPAALLNSVLNGATLNLSLLDNDSLASLVSAGLGGSPSVADLIQALDAVGANIHLGTPIGFGGLLSPGGSLLDAFGIDLNASAGGSILGGGVSLDLPAQHVGLIGSLISLTQAMAHGLGWNVFDANPILDVPGNLGIGAGSADFSDIFGTQGSDLFSMLESELGQVFGDLGLGDVWSELLAVF